MNFHRNHWLLLGTIFFGFVFLAIIIAIGPAYWVQIQVELQSTPTPLTALQQRGLDVYIAEGCVGCHTQQVRPIPMDKVWGRPSAPSDYANLGPMDVWRPYAPAVLGSERVGPDLSDVGARQPSETWQYMHLYNPRAVVKASIMPAFPWLFTVTEHPADDAVVVPVSPPYAPTNGKVVPNERGKALVAYLLSLHQQAEKTQSPQIPAPQASTSQAQPGVATANGDTLYSNNCASCHQANGEGLPGAFPPLAGDPVVIAQDASEHIEIVLNGAHGRNINGKTYGSPMPPFGSRLSDEEIAAIVNHERSSWGNNAPTVTADDVAAQRAGEQKKPTEKKVKQSQPQVQQKMPVANGATVYSSNCAGCHQPNGEGLPGAFPALAGNAVVIADDPTEHIDTVLNGAQGRTIDGKKYAVPMPGLGASLSDDEIAAVVNHERSSWGNDARRVTVDDVAKQRAGGK